MNVQNERLTMITPLAQEQEEDVADKIIALAKRRWEICARLATDSRKREYKSIGFGIVAPFAFSVSSFLGEGTWRQLEPMR